ncbi:MAG: hypothetical protein ACE5LV_09495 [Candidatus Aminicenantales bacterium]
MECWLQDVSLGWGKVIATVFFAGMALWAWFRPKSYIYRGAPDRRRWRDLRLWATLLLGIQVVLYLVF